ncbi:MAG: hypothetical protein KDD60_08705, partial [Bdellovibrionales bacterium]|nr:hypothetical protein [Bdellovibrionales bacterium]
VVHSTHLRYELAEELLLLPEISPSAQRTHSRGKLSMKGDITHILATPDHPLFDLSWISLPATSPCLSDSWQQLSPPSGKILETTSGVIALSTCLQKSLLVDGGNTRIRGNLEGNSLEMISYGSLPTALLVQGYLSMSNVLVINGDALIVTVGEVAIQEIQGVGKVDIIALTGDLTVHNVAPTVSLFAFGYRNTLIKGAQNSQTTPHFITPSPGWTSGISYENT